MKELFKDFYTEIVAGILTMTSAGILSYLKNKTNKLKESEKIIHDISDIHDELNNLNSNLRARRVMIASTHNGGGIPKIGEALYTSINYEVYDYPATGIKKDWQKRLIDKSYLKLLRQALIDSYIIINVKDMEESILKESYIEEGIAAICIFIIKKTDKKLFHLFIMLPDGSEELTATSKYRIESSVQVLKSFF